MKLIIIFVILKIAISNRHSEKSLKVLKQWFEANRNHPYASLKTKKKLSFEANLSIRQITNWLYYERKKMKSNRLMNRTTTKRKDILQKHFFTINKFPNKKELNELAKTTGQSEKVISAWFANQRFKNKTL